MSSRIRVERALALIPDSEELLPLIDAFVGTSEADRDKTWDRSSAYATLGTRLADPARVREQLPAIVAKAQERLQRLYTYIVEAVQEQQAGNLLRAAELLVEAGELEETNRRLRNAEKLYTLGMELARNLREKRPLILALRRLGRLARAAGTLDSAWSYYEESYQLSVDQMDLPGQIIACQGLGSICGLRGQRDLSRTWFERGLELALQLDDPALLWPCYTNLAIPARQSGDLEEAEEMLAHARMHIDRAQDESALLFWYNNRGLVLMERRDAPGAEQVYREALARSSDPFWEMTIRINLGETLIPQGRLFEAEEEARRAEELAILHGFVPYLVDVYLLLGSLARERRDEEGFVFYEQALSVCRERSLPEVREAFVYWGYGKLQLACGRLDEALAYLERAREAYQGLGLVPELDGVESDLETVRLALPLAEG